MIAAALSSPEALIGAAAGAAIGCGVALRLLGWWDRFRTERAWRKAMAAFDRRIAERRAKHQPVCDVMAERQEFTLAHLRAAQSHNSAPAGWRGAR